MLDGSGRCTPTQGIQGVSNPSSSDRRQVGSPISKEECRATEVEVAVYTLTRMLEFRRPKYVRTA